MSKRVDLSYTAGPQMNPQEMLTQSSLFSLLRNQEEGGGGKGLRHLLPIEPR